MGREKAVRKGCGKGEGCERRCVGRLYECLALSSREEKRNQISVTIPTESGRDPFSGY